MTKSNEYDILDRKRKEEVSFGGKKYQTKYEYLKSGDHATNLIKRIRYGGGTFTGYDGNIEYSYDNNGNISEVVEDGKLVACYEYDKLNRLIRENSKHFDKTVVYRYDRNGNILHKDIYPYTLEKDIRGLAPTESVPYVYSSVWFDQLTEYGAREPRGELFTYDKLGNPIVYRGHTLSWANGRQLTKFGEVKYEYGADGQRTSREVEKVKHEYAYLEGKLFSERWSGNELRYYYDESGVCGIHYDGTKYYFRKNVQGDVTAIYKADGSRVALYKYDAWGNCKVYDGSGAEKGEADFIGNINPIRYRGYYYDNETKLYYLKTRYYDPEIGRFMNADDVQLLPTLAEEVNGINLYAYCGNNPVMAVDPEGSTFHDLNDAVSYIDTMFQMAAYIILGMAKNIGQNSLNVVNAAKTIQGFAQGASKVFTGTAYILTAICSIQSGIEKGYSADRIATDVVFDLAVAVVMAQIGSWVGSLIPIPVLGTLIGAALGFVLGALYSKFSVYIDDLKESFYNGIMDVANRIGGIINNVNDYLNRGWNWLTGKIRRWFN